MSDLSKIVITAAATLFSAMIVFSLGYFKDKKFANSKYTERVLINLYIPLYKLLESFEYDPYVGYIGISKQQLWLVKEIIDENPELVDPKLEKCLYKIIEEIDLNYQHDRVGNEIYDQNYQLYNYVKRSFNITRKSLGLPYDKYYASYWSFLYRFIRKVKSKREFKRVMRNLH